MLSAVGLLVALEMLLLPAWAGVMCVRRAARESAGHPGTATSRAVAGGSPRRPREALGLRSAVGRLGRAAVAVAAVAMVVLAASLPPEGPAVAEALQSQVVAMGFLVLLAGIAVAADRAAGPRAAQMITALAGWLLLAGVILAGPLADLPWHGYGPCRGRLQGPAQAAMLRLAAHVNPLVVAERELGLDWLHQDITYRLTPLGESFGYLLGDLAWWKTALGHVFVGSGLLAFGAKGSCAPKSA